MASPWFKRWLNTTCNTVQSHSAQCLLYCHPPPACWTNYRQEPFSVTSSVRDYNLKFSNYITVTAPQRPDPSFPHLCLNVRTTSTNTIFTSELRGLIFVASPNPQSDKRAHCGLALGLSEPSQDHSSFRLNHFRHFLCVRLCAAPCKPSRRGCLKLCGIITICAITTSRLSFRGRSDPP